MVLPDEPLTATANCLSQTRKEKNQNMNAIAGKTKYYIISFTNIKQ